MYFIGKFVKTSIQKEKKEKRKTDDGISKQRPINQPVLFSLDSRA